MKNIQTITKKTFTGALVLALAFGSFGSLAGGFVSVANAADTAKVTIEKYIDGVKATTLTAGGADFTMDAKYTMDGVQGTAQYVLNAEGNYEVVTQDMTLGSNYMTREVVDGTIVASTCDTEGDFTLVGYTTGDTLLEAQTATPTMSNPRFENIANDKYVIVWNEDCAEIVVDPATSAQVTIAKYIDGEMATAESADSAEFQMFTTYTIDGVENSGTYTLTASGYNGDPTAYQAKTVEMPLGSDYATNEVMDATTAENCSADEPFALNGYSTGDTYAQAQNAPVTSIAPDFMALTGDKYVIVWNADCTTSDDIGGEIGGEVTGGTTGTLEVTSVEATDTDATANGSFSGGWEYVFNITVPTDEQDLSMKFSDWTDGNNTIPAGSNIRISSAQADNGGATVLITSANTYSTPALRMTGDLDMATPGMQVKVVVEVAVPSNTPDGAYTTSYGVKTL